MAKKNLNLEGRFLSPKVILSYPHFYRPKPKSDDKPNELYYQSVLVIPVEAQGTAEYAAMKEAATKAVHQMWPEGVPATLRTPFRKCSEKPDMAKEFGPDAVFMNVYSKSRPEVVDQEMRPITDESRIYGGCFARVSLSCYAYENKQNGVAFGLGNVQFLGDGKPLGNRRPAEADFSPVKTEAAGATRAASSLF